MKESSSSGRATRRDILALLRREPRTISALAEQLGLTASAVRMQVTALERDGLVRRGATSHGARRPAVIYEVAPGIDTLLCAAYVPFVADLLQTLGDALPTPRVTELMHATGRRLVARHPRPTGSLRRRARAASAFLNQLGALTEVEADHGRLVIRGFDCPLAAAVRGRPEVCHALESVVAELAGAPVHECCDRSGRPRCCFEILAPPIEETARARRG